MRKKLSRVIGRVPPLLLEKMQLLMARFIVAHSDDDVGDESVIYVPAAELPRWVLCARSITTPPVWDTILDAMLPS